MRSIILGSNHALKDYYKKKVSVTVGIYTVPNHVSEIYK